jgi:hypothetical protein
MLITVFSATSCGSKQRPRHGAPRTHLVLAGISQTVFLKQWGEPETQIGLNCLGSLCNLGSLFLIAEPAVEVRHSVWIYKKKDRILFFTRKRLTSHFKWSEFKERCKKPEQGADCGWVGKSTPFITLALVA